MAEQSFTADAVITREWMSDDPFYLQVVRPDGSDQIIDVAEYGWHATYAEWMRGRLRWYLMRKLDGFAVMVVDVADGDQPFYYRHTVERLKGINAGMKLVSHCIGAKRVSGHEDRIYVLPNGIICTATDIDPLSDAIIDSL